MGSKKGDKSWQNAEIVLYPEQYGKMREILETGWVKKWAWIEHDKDGQSPHIHLLCGWAPSVTKTSVIVNRFGCRENQIERIKGTWSDAEDYLTHGNAPDKYQYDPQEVHANFDWETEAKQSKHNKRKALEELIDAIGDGTVREYNLYEHVTVAEYAKHKTVIQRAFDWRKNFVMGNLEQLVEEKKIVWVYGETGTGKTTFAKKLARSVDLVYTITSNGRNMFDEYRDQPCLIIDDLRPQDMRFTDLLGILDPYNHRAAQARYQNKALQAQLLIVTTILSPEDFCSQYGDDSEDYRQLYRRIANVYWVTQSHVYEYEYQEGLRSRVQTNSWPNYWLQMEQRKAKRGNLSDAISRMAEQMYTTLSAEEG